MIRLSDLSPAHTAALTRLHDDIDNLGGERRATLIGETETLNDVVVLLLSDVSIDAWGMFRYRLTDMGRRVLEKQNA